MGSTPISRYELCYLDGRQSVAGEPPVHDSMSDPLVPPTASTESPWLVWGRSVFALTIVAILLALGVANIGTRARWHEVEDGVLWAGRAEGVTALEVARGSAADAAGIHRGDVLLAINGSPVQTPADVVEFQHRGHEGTRLAYTLLRVGTQEALELSLAPAPRASSMYFVLAAVGLFTLVVGASVRLRRPRDQATLHFFWLCVAFFGAFTFSFNGPLDRLDWIFYWGDVVAMALLPPLLLHFTIVFPERPGLKFSYAVPWPLGVDPPLALQLTAIPLGLVPLTFASAIVRYRLRDVEVIVKRGLAYTAFLAASVALYFAMLKLTGFLVGNDGDQHNWIIALLATMVVVLLAQPVKDAVQNALDRVFYRDRYDYRRALVAFARDLNSDLDIVRLSQRLVARIVETLVVDRMALMLADERSGDFTSMGDYGFAQPVSRLTATSSIMQRI